MYGIYTYIWLIFMVNVGKHTVHGSYGYIYNTYTYYTYITILTRYFFILRCTHYHLGLSKLSRIPVVNPWWWVSLESAHVVCRFWCGHSPVFLLVLGRWVVLWSRLILIVFVTPPSLDASSTWRLSFGFNARDAIIQVWLLVGTSPWFAGCWGKLHNAKWQDARRVVPTALFLGLFISGGITCVAGLGRLVVKRVKRTGLQQQVKDLRWNKLIHTLLFSSPRMRRWSTYPWLTKYILWPSFITSSNFVEKYRRIKFWCSALPSKKRVIPFEQNLT